MAVRARLGSTVLLASAIAACVLALPWAFLTQVETDPGWNDSLWADGSWRGIAWALTAAGGLAAVTAFGYAFAYRSDRQPRQRSIALAALVVYVSAAGCWIAGAFLAAQPIGS